MPAVAEKASFSEMGIESGDSSMDIGLTFLKFRASVFILPIGFGLYGMSNLISSVIS
jgi:hypothetical protein